METTFLMLDMENVQPDDLSAIGDGPFKIKVFLGPHQTKVPVELARAMQGFGPAAEYIQMEGSGNNALDFHIAYYLGRLAVEHPDAHFRIISQDTGFDPLVAHLSARKVPCKRLPSLAGLRTVSSSDSKPASDRISVIIADLIKRQDARPRTLKKLNSTIHALFQNQLSEDEVRALIKELVQRGVVKMAEAKLSYELPDADILSCLHK